MTMQYDRSKNDTLKTAAHPLRMIFLSLTTAMFAAFFVFVCMGTWQWMQKPTSFPIKKIVVQGNFTHETPMQLQKIIREQLSGGFFSLHLAAAKQHILALPWVADVSFRRVWPNTVEARITEQTAIARFSNNGILSATGKIFYPDMQTIPTDLPDLNGPIDQAQTMLSFYQTMNTAAKSLGLSVILLHLNATQSWYLQLSNQVIVNLGRKNALERFDRLVALYPTIVQSSQNPVTLVDLRYPNGFAVQYQNSNIAVS